MGALWPISCVAPTLLLCLIRSSGGQTNSSFIDNISSPPHSVSTCGELNEHHPLHRRAHFVGDFSLAVWVSHGECCSTRWFVVRRCLLWMTTAGLIPAVVSYQHEDYAPCFPSLIQRNHHVLPEKPTHTKRTTSSDYNVTKCGSVDVNKAKARRGVG